MNTTNPLAAHATAQYTDYETLMKRPSQEYLDKYELYEGKLAKIKETISTWKIRYQEVGKLNLSQSEEAAELQAKVQEYIGYRDVRDDLKTISELFKSTLANCKEPVLDSSTLQEMQRMKVDLEILTQKREEIFSQKVPILKEQAEKIELLYKQVITEVENLKLAGEPLAQHYYNLKSPVASWFAVPTFLNTAIGRAGFFSYYVDEEVTNRKNAQILKEESKTA